MKEKILDIEELSKICKASKSKGKKIVHCHGVFDLLHIGHIKHFEEAKSCGDILVVTVTPDEFVFKGPNRPAFTTELRLEAIAALEVVDYVATNKWPTAVETLSMLKPDIYFKGPDYKNNDEDITGKIKEEAKIIKSISGSIKYSEDITFSSSSLLNKYSAIYSEEQKNFISSLDKSLKLTDIKLSLESLKDLKVLVIGETILDQYVFCEALGKSGKEPVLVLRDLYTEEYLGGSAAIANHLSDFCGSISLISCLGEKREHENFIKENLAGNINAKFIKKSKSPTIVKKRFVDHITKNKSLGVYSLNDDALTKKDENKFLKLISKEIKRHDMVIITDYGHGLISESMAKYIEKESPYTALNAQINAANSNFHTIRKYKNVDCVIINESELRNELRSKDGNLENLMKTISKYLRSTFTVVTRGSQGASLYNNKKGKFINCPAFASKVVDKIGSGDAMLALLSACLKTEYDERFSLLIGSLAAAQSVESIGNSESVKKEIILKTIQHALK